MLWEKSGHWEKFREHMFIAEVDEGGKGHSEDQRSLALKPMNCPGHVQIFRQGLRATVIYRSSCRVWFLPSL